MKKRLAAEFIGTFVIVFCPVAVGGHSGLLISALASGLPVLAMVAALSSISAAHLNPVVTFGLTLAGRFPWRAVPGYVGAQVAGAVFAGGVAALMYGPGGGVHLPTDPGAVGRNFGTELILTFMLMLVIMAAATDRRVPAPVPPLAIGLTVVFDILIGGPITGGSMNPARSLGPALFAGPAALAHLWLYTLAPLAGAALAARFYEFIRLDPSEAKSAPEIP